MKLSELFDGATHMLIPGEDFEAAVVQEIGDLSVEDEDEELGPLESPTLVAELIDRRGSGKNITLPGFDAQQGWGALSMVATSLCTVIGVDKEQYQRNIYTPGGQFDHSEYSFAIKVTEDSWQGGRL